MPYQFDENKINKAPYKNCRVIFPSEDYILNEAYEGP